MVLNLSGASRRFLRFPGGCYVEGVSMHNAFFWKPSVGPLEERPGHWNGPWEYWSTDGEQAVRQPVSKTLAHGGGKCHRCMPNTRVWATVRHRVAIMSAFQP